jgi:uncharacterized membrane protein YciS (DUF1049 family)
MGDFLDQVESGLTLFYRVFLIIVAVAAVLGAIFLFRYIDQGSWTQGGAFFIVIGLLLFLGWVISQFAWLRRRQEPLDMPPVKFTKTREGPLHRFTFTMGPEAAQPPDPTPAQPKSGNLTFSKTFSLGASSVPKKSRPTPAQIEQAESWQREGRDWDSICSLTDPHYAGWEPAEKEVYKALLQALVAAYRVDRGGA